ncbi:methyltransferase domain-containing protein [Paracoccus suum]|uniref:Methyltransferase domain-containing protein n=1 Tax=Paracoccus suum TaxID=2259340 RepID=A0A344PMH0_9RHOB|nr:methyltransferase domain-containing protein [Paracoccus suum]AXC50575.1 methyltransferase domain-containing protein [Paracoccus suum]
MISNATLRDEIRDYWSARAPSFDAAPGHGIATPGERKAWQDLLIRHLGPGQGGRALDLACGTGEMSGLLCDLGYQVTGLDWSEPMLGIARAKAWNAGRAITFRQADAEITMEPDASHDVLLTRHLVWTLVDPAAAFAEWRRILRPGGRLLIIDGDFVSAGRAARLLNWIERRIAPGSGGSSDPDLAAQHRSILRRVHFHDGARAEVVAGMLHSAGFTKVTVDRGLGPINRMIGRHAGFLHGLKRQTQHRYAISATRPAR